MRYMRCINPKANSNMKAGAVFEVLGEGKEKGTIKIRSISGSELDLYAHRFKSWVPEVGDEVIGPDTLVRVIADIDPRMFPNGKTGMRLLDVRSGLSEWLAVPLSLVLPVGIKPFTCRPPRQLNPKVPDGQEARDLSHMDKTLVEHLMEDRQRKLTAAIEMAAAGPQLRPVVVGPEKDPAFLRDEEALGKRKVTIKAWKEQISRARNAIKEAHAELIKLVGKEEADAV